MLNSDPFNPNYRTRSAGSNSPLVIDEPEGFHLRQRSDGTLMDGATDDDFGNAANTRGLELGGFVADAMDAARTEAMSAFVGHMRKLASIAKFWLPSGRAWAFPPTDAPAPLPAAEGQALPVVDPGDSFPVPQARMSYGGRHLIGLQSAASLTRQSVDELAERLGLLAAEGIEDAITDPLLTATLPTSQEVNGAPNAAGIELAFDAWDAATLAGGGRLPAWGVLACAPSQVAKFIKDFPRGLPGLRVLPLRSLSGTGKWFIMPQRPEIGFTVESRLAYSARHGQGPELNVEVAASILGSTEAWWAPRLDAFTGPVAIVRGTI